MWKDDSVPEIPSTTFEKSRDFAYLFVHKSPRSRRISFIPGEVGYWDELRMINYTLNSFYIVSIMRFFNLSFIISLKNILLKSSYFC